MADRCSRLARSLSRGTGSLLAVLALAVVAMASCSSGDTTSGAAATSVVVAGTVAPAATPVTPAAVVTAAASPATTPAAAPLPDGSAALAAAVASIADGYHFTTTVTVDGATALSADGDRVADGTRLALTGNGGTVSYVITPQGTWVLPENGSWEALDTAPADTDPITALKSPSAVVVDGTDGTTSHLTATVAASALGISTDAAATAAVQVTVNGTTITNVAYSTTVQSHPTVVTAVIGPVVDGSAVTPP